MKPYKYLIPLYYPVLLLKMNDTYTQQLLIQHIEIIKKYIHKINIKNNYNLTNEEKDDLFQDICVKLLKGGIKNFKGQCKFSSYLFTIVKNTLKTYAESKMRGNTYDVFSSLGNNDEDDAYIGFLDTFCNVTIDYSDAVAKQEIIEIIQQTVESFPARLQLIYDWYFIKNITQAQIANMCKCSQPTIAEHIEKIRKAIVNVVEAKYKGFIKELQ